MFLHTDETQKIIDLLTNGHIGIFPTDTIYGIHCLADNVASIARVYQAKKRPKEMPFITLISNLHDIERFHILPTSFELTHMNALWPGPNTLIFTTSLGETRSFRLPNSEFLIKILDKTGPLLSTSANPHGSPNATSVSDAYAYFGDSVDFYVDGGNLSNPPSNIYKFDCGQLIKIR